MDKDTKQVLGCVTIVLIGLLIWIGFRSDGIVQFLAIAGTMIGSVVLIFLGLNLVLMGEGAGLTITGIVLMAVAILGFVSTGMFLFTGNYARAIRVQRPWDWGKPYATEVAVADSEEPASEQAQPTKVPTATSIPRPTQTPLPTFTPVAASVQAGEVIVPQGDERSFGQVTQNLNDIWKLSPAEASATATQLRAESNQASGDALLAAGLLTAAAHQRAGENGAAQDAYNALLSGSPGTPYAASAQYALTMLGIEPEDVKDRIKKLRAIFNKPAEDGWFLSGDTWAYTDSRRAAALDLVALQGDYLSFRFFNMIYERSTFPQEYSFLFIFIVVILVVRLVTLPLSYRGQQMAVQLRKLQPRIDRINSLWADDQVEKNKRLMELYQDSGVNVWNGCLIAMVDLVIVVWVFLSVRSFAPQFYLDGARFWMADDITVFNLQLILVWVGVMLLQALITYLSQPKTSTVLQVGCGTVLIFGIVAGVAYYFKTPVYGFILYALMAIGTLLVSLILLPIALLASRR